MRRSSSWSQHLSILVSGLVGFALANILSPQELQDFGWRIAFLIGVVIVPLGVVMRRSMPETFHAPERSTRNAAALRPHLWVAGLGVMLLASATIGNYIATYMTTYAIVTLRMPVNISFAATVVVGLCGVTFDLVSGTLSDRFGRKPLMLIPGALLLILILPAFYIIAHFRTAATLLIATAILASLMSFCVCPSVVWLTESLPASIRSSGLAVIYAVSIATFGGTTQYAVTWLIKRTGNPLAPAWYWTLAIIVGVAAMSATRETAPRKLSSPRNNRTRFKAIALDDGMKQGRCSLEHDMWFGPWKHLPPQTEVCATHVSRGARLRYHSSPPSMISDP